MIAPWDDQDFCEEQAAEAISRLPNEMECRICGAPTEGKVFCFLPGGMLMAPLCPEHGGAALSRHMRQLEVAHSREVLAKVMRAPSLN